ncbi:MAG: hypothetical protein EBU90_21170, partial [Proteobacteria bacterium]|nr:hypothetical protein [Pseudomonadota bacterium]
MECSRKSYSLKMECVMKKLLLSFLLLSGHHLQAASSDGAQAEKEANTLVRVRFTGNINEQGNPIEQEYPLAVLNQFAYFEIAFEFRAANMKSAKGTAEKDFIECFVFKETLDILIALAASETQEAFTAKLTEYPLSGLIQLYLAADYLQLKDFDGNLPQFNRLDLLLEQIVQKLIAADFAAIDQEDFEAINANNDLCIYLIEKLYKRAAWSVLHTLQGHTGLVYSVAFSPDGQSVVTASTDRTAKLWDVQTGQLLLTLQGHTGLVSSVAFSPDRQSVATGSWDSTANLWNVQTGQLLLTLQGHTG